MSEQELEQKCKDYDTIARALTLCGHNGEAVRQLAELQCKLRDQIRELEYDPFRVTTRHVTSRVNYALNNVETATQDVLELLKRVWERKQK